MIRPAHLLTALTAAALLFVAPTVADAAGGFAVLTPAARGRGAARVARATRQAIERQLRHKGAEVIDLSSKHARLLKRSMRRRASLRRQARRLGVEHVVVGQVRRRGRRFVIALRVVAADSHRTVARERLRVRAGQSVAPSSLLASFGSAPRQTRTVMASAGAPQSQVHDTENPPL